MDEAEQQLQILDPRLVKRMIMVALPSFIEEDFAYLLNTAMCKLSPRFAENTTFFQHFSENPPFGV
jgi:hypothetical protein